MKGLLWTKLVVPSIGSMTQVGAAVSSHLPVVLSSPMNRESGNLVVVFRLQSIFNIFRSNTNTSQNV